LTARRIAVAIDVLEADDISQRKICLVEEVPAQSSAAYATSGEPGIRKPAEPPLSLPIGAAARIYLRHAAHAGVGFARDGEREIGLSTHLGERRGLERARLKEYSAAPFPALELPARRRDHVQAQIEVDRALAQLINAAA